MNDTIVARVSQLRQWLEEQQLDALLIPHEDEFLGEYLPAHNERLEWATGFTGSAGAAVITRDTAAIFVDGRYTVQVRKQAPETIFQYCHLIEQPPLAWAAKHLPKGSKLAVDAKLHASSWLKHAQHTLLDSVSIHIVTSNPIDQLWRDRPSPMVSEVRLMDESLSGLSSTDKRAQIATILLDKKADAALLTQLDSICWLLNIRGMDVACLPVLLSSAVIHADKSVDFFIEPSRLPADFIQHVGSGVRVHMPDSLDAFLQTLAGNHVLVDPATSNAWFSLTLQEAGAAIIESADPCQLPKAQKNPVEVAGMKACHIRDGAAMAKFMAWLDSEVANGHLHDEALLADKLEVFRREDSSLVDLSFDTISAAAGNAAMCHYNHNNQPEPGKLELGNFYLVDSGAHYPDGTTDITRTVAIGELSEEMKQQFTLVLKGHIALSQARFPKGTCGHHLDALARQHLWSHGYDYDHGTGHGVGHCLSVHEGPQRISKVTAPTALVPGMVVSNEPGYYRADAFGIRIENLELVTEFTTQGDFSVLGFESLTRCPIDKHCIKADLLTQTEKKWLNNYHQTVFDVISPLVEGATLQWLREATSPLA